MSRFPAILSAVALLALAPAVAVAQSDDAIASVTVAGDGNVTVINTAGLSFGIQPSGAIVHSSDVPTAASWNVGFNQAADYVMTFSLPSELATGTGLSVPITYGPTSASSPALEFPFDPATGIGVAVPVDGIFVDILLGADVQGDGTGDVSVNLVGAPAGTYTGTITLTVAPF